MPIYPPPSGSGSVATDTIWTAKGDTVAATGSAAASKIAVGSDGTVLTADAASTPGVKWAAAAGGAPTGSAGGDLTGTYPNPTIKSAVSLTGVPLAPTAAVDTNTTQIATTAMVLAQSASATPIVSSGAGAVGTSTRYARGDHVHPAQAGTLTSSSNYITADVTMTTSSTFYDGPTLTLAAGTYLLVGAVQILPGTSSIRTLTAKLWDGTTTISKAVTKSSGSANPYQVSLALSGLVTPGGSTTYKISVTSDTNSDTLQGTSPNDKDSYLIAIKIA